jgi:hypothetical protein
MILCHLHSPNLNCPSGTFSAVFRAHKVAFTGEKNPRLAAEKVPEGQLRLGLCKWQRAFVDRREEERGGAVSAEAGGVTGNRYSRTRCLVKLEKKTRDSRQKKCQRDS